MDGSHFCPRKLFQNWSVSVNTETDHGVASIHNPVLEFAHKRVFRYYEVLLPCAVL